MAICVSGLYRYPLKSGKAISVEVASVEEQGIWRDREFMLVDHNHTFITQRQHPNLRQISVDYTSIGVRLSAPGMEPLTFERKTEGVITTVTIWRDHPEAIDQGDAVAAWLEQFLHIPCRLVTMPTTYRRIVNQRYAPRETDSVFFQDGYPFLLISEASLEELNRRLAEQGEAPVSMKQFRPNIVVSGTSPHAEDTWKKIRIGNVSYLVVKPCARCLITLINQETGMQRKEPLRTLARYRHVPNKGVLFGQNLIHLDRGIIRVGDEVEILEYQ